jgi:hypothetical protein
LKLSFQRVFLPLYAAVPMTEGTLWIGSPEVTMIDWIISNLRSTKETKNDIDTLHCALFSQFPEYDTFITSSEFRSFFVDKVISAGEYYA